MSTFEEIDTNIQKWMSEEQDWTYQIENGIGFRKGYVVTLKNCKRIGIIIDNIDRITIQTKDKIPDDYLNSYKLSPNKYDFIYDLKIYLMGMDVALELIPDIEKLESTNIFTLIYFDGFSRDKFINSILKIADAKDLINIMWKRFTDIHNANP